MMRCEHCRKRPATIHLTDIRGDVKREVHLCAACAAEKGFSSDAALKLPKLLGAIVQAKGAEAEKARSGPARDAACPYCGIDWKTFRDTGRLGCPHDYTVFGDRLRGMIEQFHGDAKHVGKRPPNAPGAGDEPDPAPAAPEHADPAEVIAEQVRTVLADFAAGAQAAEAPGSPGAMASILEVLDRFKALTGAFVDADAGGTFDPEARTLPTAPMLALGDALLKRIRAEIARHGDGLPEGATAEDFQRFMRVLREVRQITERMRDAAFAAKAAGQEALAESEAAQAAQAVPAPKTPPRRPRRKPAAKTASIAEVEAAAARRRHVKRLEARLAQAVEKEDYAEAARLRDELRALESPPDSAAPEA